MAVIERSDNSRSADVLPQLLMGLFALVTSASGFFLTVFLRDDLGFSGTEIGWVFAVQAVTGLLVAFPAGLLNDRFSSRNIMLLALVLQAAGYVFMAKVAPFALFIVVFFFWTIANGLFKMSLDVLVFKTDTGRRTATRISRYQFWRFFGLTIGTVIAGYVLQALDFRLTLIVTAAVLLGLGMMTRQLPKATLTIHPFSEYRADFANPRVLFFAFWLFLFATHWGAEATCYSLFLRTNLDLSYGQMGWYLAAEYFVVTLTMLFAGPYADQKGALYKAAVVGLTASGIGHIGMIWPPVAASLAFRMLHGAGDGLMFLVLYVGVARLFDLGRVGGNAGFVNFMLMLGFVVGSLIYSPIGEQYGYATSLWTSGLLTLLLVLPLYLVRRAARET